MYLQRVEYGEDVLEDQPSIGDRQQSKDPRDTKERTEDNRRFDGPSGERKHTELNIVKVN